SAQWHVGRASRGGSRPGPGSRGEGPGDGAARTGTPRQGGRSRGVRRPEGGALKGPTFKWPSTGRLRRTVLMLGVVGATTGGLLFSAAAAQAVTGSGPGQLALNPPSGATTLTPTWSTTTACPTGFQVSAVLFALNTDGTVGSSVSPTVSSVT